MRSFKTSFLFSLTDMDKLEVQLDNLNNQLVQRGKKFPIVQKWGHPWLVIGPHRKHKTIASCHLTETEIRQLHKRFGHFSVRKLHELLERGGMDDVTKEAIERINKNCHQFQIHGGTPGRFRFSVKDDIDFNAEIVVNIMYTAGQCTPPTPLVEGCLTGLIARPVSRVTRLDDSPVVTSGL